MAFKPCSGHHSISEVVFVVVCGRNFSQSEIENVKQAHGEWEHLLPKVDVPRVIALSLGPDETMEQMPEPPGQITFSALKRDGSLDWRLAIENNWIAVNCLTYTRWDVIKSRAFKLLRALASHLPPELDANAATLQYVDTFDFVDELDAYDVRLLLDTESGFFPSNVLNHGPVWHVHQGWFEDSQLTKVRSILNRVNLDSRVNDGRALVKIDHIQEGRLQERSKLSELLSEGVLEQEFDEMHQKNKAVLLELLVDSVAREISLNE